MVRKPDNSHSKTRLPTADIPVPIRNADEQLKYQPSLEFRDKLSPHIIKIGPNSISSHILSPYCGWEKFQPTLSAVLDKLYSGLSDVKITRIGLRYINAVTPKDHFIEKSNDLKLEINVGGVPLTAPFNLSYSKEYGDIRELVRIVSPTFVIGTALPPDYVVLVDIDVSTPDGFPIVGSDTAKDWIERAHIAEKEEFFRLWPDEILKKLRRNDHVFAKHDITTQWGI